MYSMLYNGATNTKKKIGLPSHYDDPMLLLIGNEQRMLMTYTFVGLILNTVIGLLTPCLLVQHVCVCAVSALIHTAAFAA